MSEYTLHCGDALEYMRTMDAGSVDCVVTDPPYPDYHQSRYFYSDGMIDFLNSLHCRQFIFWSIKVDFPLDYTARHVWDKRTGAGSEYEFIYERNGHRNFKVFRYYLINSTVAASFTGDVFTGHPSQKPKELILDLLDYGTKPSNLVFDPFMGSGTTGVACMQLGRRFIGCEIDPTYFKIARARIEAAAKQIPMPLPERQANPAQQAALFE